MQKYNRVHKYGILRLEDNGRLLFVPLDKSALPMSPTKIDPTLFKTVSHHDYFSFHNQNIFQMDPHFLHHTFFEARITEWSAHHIHPFCEVSGQQHFGSIFDLDNLKRVIILDNGIREDDFPSKVMEQVQKVEEIKFQGRKVYSGVSIDKKSTMAIDDVISMEKVEDRWKIGIHISDVSPYV